MSVAAYMCSATVVLAVLLFGSFLWLVRPPKCRRCGRREWVPLPHNGTYVRYCRACCYTEDAATGRPV